VSFWDSSAVVPLLIEQSESSACRQRLRAHPTTFVWTLTRTEVVSALCRLRREGALQERQLAQALARLGRYLARWGEVDAVEPVREQAERLLRAHPLRAADALQLAAAVVAADGHPRGRALVSLDEALLEAAGREGFDAIRPGG